MGSVSHVLMLGAMFGRCYSYTALLSCYRHIIRRNVNMLGVAGMGKIGSSRVEGAYLPL